MSSPGLSQTVKEKINFNLTQTSFGTRQNSKEGSKKVISLKQIKFPKKKTDLPRPPLHKKTSDDNTAEALLKMADEGLANIE